MLEIVLLYLLCKKMGEKLRAKGWEKTIWMQILVVLSWFVGAAAGTAVYSIYILIKDGQKAMDGIGLEVYPIAILCSASVVGILFFIVSRLRDKNQPPMLRQRMPR